MLPASGSLVNFGHTPIDFVTATFIKWRFDNVPAPNQESDTAPGDSGGPQFITVGGVLQVASVTSGGSKANASFGDVSYNTRVDIATAWIDSITGGPPVNGNNPPVINSLSSFPDPAVPGQTVTFTAAASDPDGDALTYHWIFGDGSEDAAGSANEMHTYAIDGSYALMLLVTDDRGGSTESDMTVTVGNGQNPKPSTVSKQHFTLNFQTPSKSTLQFELFNFDFLFFSKSTFANTFNGASVKVYAGSVLIDTMTLNGIKAIGGNGGVLNFLYRTGNVGYQVRGSAGLAAALAPFGAVNATTTASIVVPLRFEINGVFYGGDAPFSYTSKQGKSGSGK